MDTAMAPPVQRPRQDVMRKSIGSRNETSSTGRKQILHHLHTYYFERLYGFKYAGFSRRNILRCDILDNTFKSLPTEKDEEEKPKPSRLASYIPVQLDNYNVKSVYKRSPLATQRAETYEPAATGLPHAPQVLNQTVALYSTLPCNSTITNSNLTNGTTNNGTLINGTLIIGTLINGTLPCISLTNTTLTNTTTPSTQQNQTLTGKTKTQATIVPCSPFAHSPAPDVYDDPEAARQAPTGPVEGEIGTEWRQGHFKRSERSIGLEGTEKGYAARGPDGKEEQESNEKEEGK